MYHGKRYTESGFGARRGPNILLRVIVSVLLAAAISFGLIWFGAFLGEKVPDDNGDEVTDTAETTARDVFEFKDIDEKTVADVNALPLFGEDKPTSVFLNVSDSEGKLCCITSINSLIYGNAVSSELRPIEALLYEARLKADRVSVRFTPFVNEKAQNYADLCSAAVIGALSEYEIDEIVLCLDGVSPVTAAYLKSSSKGKVKVGGAISLEVLSNEALVKEYYKALDFLVLDLTGLDIGAYKEESDASASETQNAAEAESSNERETLAQSVESVLEKYSLSVVKYSVRLRVTCRSEKDLSDFLEFYSSFRLCGYEIDGDKK